MPAYQPEKLCPDCGSVLPRSAFYKKGKSKKDGKSYLTTRCKKCHKEWRKTENREYERKAIRRWRASNRERWNAYMRQWRKVHPGSDDYRKETYRQFNSRKGRGRIPREVWEQTLKAFDYSCAYCGTTDAPLCVDHFIPQSRDGDSSIANLVPACKSCNSTKNNRLPEDFLSLDDYSRVVKVLQTLMA